MKHYYKYGGAIYSDGESVPGNKICAIQIYSTKTVHRKLDITMIFIDNKACRTCW